MIFRNQGAANSSLQRRLTHAFTTLKDSLLLTAAYIFRSTQPTFIEVAIAEVGGTA